MSKGEETRQFIIERAAPVFNIKGIEATAMSDIMEVTKLSKGALYVHFKDKEQLAQAVVQYNLQLLETKVSAATGKVKTAREKLFAFIDVLTDVLNPPVPGGCPMVNFGTEADDTNPAVNQQIHQAFEYTQKMIADIIRQGIKSGEFKSDWNYKEFATLMLATIEGGVIISRVAGNNNKVRIVTNFLKQLINDQGR
ncbi:TetR/AcrR family transcriptional regulator [Chitinophaga varians]|uniref:TetR/AcrR family transcriptional regulator n=1 Tax=Chitinophaga varians TaxID=2202339 RepID=UPI00165F4166|nr:TetR/AcrR family transcriptional regulator [Chitinophaga varians]MBC9914539.1 TetR/AcrR family transcriptional regulator [Chitinophaga varians]